MSTTISFNSALLRLLLLNEPVTGLGDVTGLLGSAGAGFLYMSLHTADPTAAGNQASAEADYDGYARSAITRDGGSFIVDDSTGFATNTSEFSSPAADAGNNTITHAGFGIAETGGGLLVAYGILINPLVVVSPIRPRFAAGQLVIKLV
jgi:hypothetical protein